VYYLFIFQIANPRDQNDGPGSGDRFVYVSTALRFFFCFFFENCIKRSFQSFCFFVCLFVFFLGGGGCYSGLAAVLDGAADVVVEEDEVDAGEEHPVRKCILLYLFGCLFGTLFFFFVSVWGPCECVVCFCNFSWMCF